MQVCSQTGGTKRYASIHRILLSTDAGNEMCRRAYSQLMKLLWTVVLWRSATSSMLDETETLPKPCIINGSRSHECASPTTSTDDKITHGKSPKHCFALNDGDSKSQSSRALGQVCVHWNTASSSLKDSLTFHVHVTDSTWTLKDTRFWKRVNVESLEDPNKGSEEIVMSHVEASSGDRDGRLLIHREDFHDCCAVNHSNVLWELFISATVSSLDAKEMRTLNSTDLAAGKDHLATWLACSCPHPDIAENGVHIHSRTPGTQNARSSLANGTYSQCETVVRKNHIRL